MRVRYDWKWDCIGVAGGTVAACLPFTQEQYEATVTSRCWWYTPLDGPWAGVLARLEADHELQALVRQEQALSPLPVWAQQIVLHCVQRVPPCGHHTFPRPQMQVVDAIGKQEAPAFFAACYMVDAARKAQLEDLCLCLDGWLANAAPGDVAEELRFRSRDGKDWAGICAQLWEVLGAHAEYKDLAVERIVLMLRAELKQGAWDGDHGARYERSHFVGAVRLTTLPDGAVSARYDTSRSPRFMRLRERLDAVWPATLPSHRGLFEEWWPCAPKSLRFLERMLWAIGHGRLSSGKSDWASYMAEAVPGFLQCEDTYPDQASAAAWWAEFTAALESWWRGGDAGTSAVGKDVQGRLGERTGLKAWLVRLYRHKLRLLEANGEQFTRLVRADGKGRRGQAMKR